MKLIWSTREATFTPKLLVTSPVESHHGMANPVVQQLKFCNQRNGKRSPDYLEDCPTESPIFQTLSTPRVFREGQRTVAAIWLPILSHEDYRRLSHSSGHHLQRFPQWRCCLFPQHGVCQTLGTSPILCSLASRVAF